MATPDGKKPKEEEEEEEVYYLAYKCVHTSLCEMVFAICYLYFVPIVFGMNVLLSVVLLT